MRYTYLTVSVLLLSIVNCVKGFSPQDMAYYEDMAICAKYSPTCADRVVCEHLAQRGYGKTRTDSIICEKKSLPVPFPPVY